MTIEKETFNVAVIATMSSGKSTTLNAMLGVSLLPSMNEACTATIYKIDDVDELDHFQARFITTSGNTSEWEKLEEQGNILELWNSSGYETIEIKGDFPHIANYQKLISFFDTPGPNNSSDKSHSEITHNIITKSKFGFVLCVMNASQFGVDDERVLLSNLLKDLSEKDQKTQIVFAVNKMDQLDLENGELPSQLVYKIRNYLIKLGYCRPKVVPVMSLISLEIRQLIEAYKSNQEVPFSKRKQKKLLADIGYLFEFSDEYINASVNTREQNKHLEAAKQQARHVDKTKIINLNFDKKN